MTHHFCRSQELFSQFSRAFDSALEKTKTEEDTIKKVTEQTYEGRRIFFNRIQTLVLDNIGDKEELLDFYTRHSDLKHEKLEDCMEQFVNYCEKIKGENKDE